MKRYGLMSEPLANAIKTELSLLHVNRPAFQDESSESSSNFLSIHFKSGFGIDACCNSSRAFENNACSTSNAQSLADRVRPSGVRPVRFTRETLRMNQLLRRMHYASRRFPRLQGRT